MNEILKPAGQVGGACCWLLVANAAWFKVTSFGVGCAKVQNGQPWLALASLARSIAQRCILNNDEFPFFQPYRI